MDESARIYYDETDRLVLEERERQDEKWGHQDHTFDEWLPILIEEVGECSQRWLKGNFGGWNERRRRLYLEELVQVVAVAHHILENEIKRGVPASPTVQEFDH